MALSKISLSPRAPAVSSRTPTASAVVFNPFQPGGGFMAGLEAAWDLADMIVTELAR